MSKPIKVKQEGSCSGLAFACSHGGNGIGHVLVQLHPPQAIQLHHWMCRSSVKPDAHVVLQASVRGADLESGQEVHGRKSSASVQCYVTTRQHCTQFCDIRMPPAGLYLLPSCCTAVKTQGCISVHNLEKQDMKLICVWPTVW